MALSTRTQQVLVGTLAAGAVVLMGWMLWTSGEGDTVSTGEQDVTMTVLCSECKHYGEMKYSQLEAKGQAAVAPPFGPGFKCPQCQKYTLYKNPMTCSGCQTPFLMSRRADGEYIRKCPKCGKED